MNTRLKLRARRRPRRLLPPLPQAWVLALSMGFFVTVLGLYNRFADLAEARAGARLLDPLLPHLPRADLAFVIFALVYGGLILALWEHARDARQAARALRALGILIALRTLAMVLVPLEAPEGMIALRDPLIEFLGSMRVLNRALFFSGHTATLFLLFTLSRERSHRIVLLASALAVAAALLIQHAHYSIDVLAAPFFALGAVAIEVRLSKLAHLSGVPE